MKESSEYIWVNLKLWLASLSLMRDMPTTGRWALLLHWCGLKVWQAASCSFRGSSLSRIGDVDVAEAFNFESVRESINTVTKPQLPNT